MYSTVTTPYRDGTVYSGPVTASLAVLLALPWEFLTGAFLRVELLLSIGCVLDSFAAGSGSVKLQENLFI